MRNCAVKWLVFEKPTRQATSATGRSAVPALLPDASTTSIFAEPTGAGVSFRLVRPARKDGSRVTEVP